MISRANVPRCIEPALSERRVTRRYGIMKIITKLIVALSLLAFTPVVVFADWFDARADWEDTALVFSSAGPTDTR